MNLANKITISRIILIPLFIFFLFNLGREGIILSLFIFVIASFSDWLDGYIARKSGQITTTGKIMDPVADKILVYSAFISFIQLNIIPFWMVIIIMARDFFVMALRVEVAAKGGILAAIPAAKMKTVLEYGSIISAFLYFITLTEVHQVILKILIYTFIGLATVFAVISGAQYFFQSKKYLVREL